jgi:hypothetical protein
LFRVTIGVDKEYTDEPSPLGASDMYAEGSVGAPLTDPEEKAATVGSLGTLQNALPL